MSSVIDQRTGTASGSAFVERLPASLRSRRALAWTLRLSDLVMIFAIYHAALWLRTGTVSSDLLQSQRLYVVVAVLMGALYLFDTYRIERHVALWRLASRVVLASISAGGIIGLLVYLVGPELLGSQYNVIGRTVLIPSLIAFSLTAIGVRSLARLSVQRLAGRVRWLVIGQENNNALSVFQQTFTRMKSPGELVILVDNPTQKGNNNIADLDRYLTERWSGVIVTGGELPPTIIDRLLHARLAGLRIYDLGEFSEQMWEKLPVHHLNSGWLALSTGFALLHEPTSAHIKRVCDVLIAGLLFILALPIMVILWILVRLTSAGPGFFRQERVGLNGKTFTCYKFRTMQSGADTGNIYTEANDQRVTALGRLLRKSRLDELPQLWNILRGDMSFIGPRAEWTKCVAEYEHVIPYYHLRHLVRPGLTGWAQVNYPYGASVEDAREKLEYDLYYLKNHSLALDFVILLRTVRVVLFGIGSR